MEEFENVSDGFPSVSLLVEFEQLLLVEEFEQFSPHSVDTATLAFPTKWASLTHLYLVNRCLDYIELWTNIDSSLLFATSPSAKSSSLLLTVSTRESVRPH
jgi:hypothetical protein